MVSEIFSAVSAERFFALSAGAVSAGFTVCLTLSLAKDGYGLKKRAWFAIIVAAFCALLKTRANILGEKDFSPLLLFFGAVFALPLFFVRTKRKGGGGATEQGGRADLEDVSRRDFVRFLDERIRNADGDAARTYSEQEFPQKREKVDTLTANKTYKAGNADYGPDFSHVKNVLQRLEPAALTFADRRQIHDLELALYDAERGDCSDETKGKINEGLGNLLKIMAKHGV